MLTKRQKEILDYINQYLQANDYSPTLEEIAGHFDLNSVATVHEHIEALKSKGYLNRPANQPRSLETKLGPDLIEVPLLGCIAAGEPIEAIEDNETITIPKNYLPKGKESYALRVKGDSMIDEGIFDEDIVLAIRQNSAQNGDTIVAIINNNLATLKKFFKEKNRIRLQPANTNLAPLYYPNILVQGKVINIIRNFEEAKEESKKKEELTEATLKYLRETDLKHKKSLGQYFTPRSVREELIKQLPNTIVNPKVLDPGCGTGEFLISAKEYFNGPKLYGWDIDEKLITISKQAVPEAILKNTDALENENYGQFDFVIGNPPYYEFTPSLTIKSKFKEIINGRLNIFSLFIFQGLKWLKEGGYLAFVVPPSMNNGAYFLNLRKYIISNSNIEYLHVLENSKIFHDALQTTMLLILKKGKNKGDYIFKKNGITIFSEDTKYLNRTLNNKLTLHDLNYQVKTGRLVWNENKNLLTNNKKNSVPLIWAQNITEQGLKFPIISEKKPQYVKTNDFDIGPAIVVNRITGSVKTAKLKSAIIPSGMKFIAENHVNVVFPPSRQSQLDLNSGDISKKKLTLKNIAKQLSSVEKLNIIRNITGNTQISKTELVKLFPIDTD